ncbi:MAG: adenylate/guanylate cyclase domain-containing protein, partial [Actinomycetia bacterium]|nr:adenylate/guanylate cyclase domain-containing protein [Actinomycetes bacterium]
QWKIPFGDMYGLLNLAFTLNTIIKQDFIYEASDFTNILVLILISIILGAIIPNVNIFKGLIVTLVLLLGFIIFNFVLFDMYNYNFHLFTPIVEIIMIFAAIVVFRVLTEEKEKQAIKGMFGKYVNPEVVEELLKDPNALKLGGENRLITVLFSDVRGFTTISEQLGDPQKLVELLNEYLGAMTDIILGDDGTLDKYVGDEIMAFWGAPIEDKDHAFKSCKSALKQMERLHELQAQWKAEGKPYVNIGIGVNTGIMTVGNMGSSARMDYTLMGDNVNLGARLEGVNKQYGTNIIISEYTYNYVRNRVVVRELDRIRVKGKSEPVLIFELIDVLE